MVKILDRHHRVTVEPFQKPGLPEQLGLTVAECEQMAWAVTPAGAQFGGAAAVNMAMAVAAKTRVPIWLYALPGIRQIQNKIYDWVVRNRHRLPGDVPYCEQFPEVCDN
ncbi:MAG TPA: DCC1-like thiol-disulfide oxidoreductase family protein [Anaerolineales bacterium]|nr:DCC1-like thiol-disulfide oxidoreductase family protein [Anaerolineales bacterium]